MQFQDVKTSPAHTGTAHTGIGAEGDAAPTQTVEAGGQFTTGGGRSLQSIGRSVLGKGNLLLACLFAAGIGCIYLLRLGGGPQIASAQQQMNQSQVDSVLTAIGSPAGAKDVSASSVVAAFYTQASQRQLPLDGLAINPFVYQPPPSKPMTPSSTTQPAAADDLAGKSAAQALEVQMQAAKSLTLQSVLMGKGGATAVISNNLLTEGQTIRGWTISRIGAKEVVLTWKEQSYTLKMR
jgi:hypothetical protein